jgi:hypothetical protein
MFRHRFDSLRGEAVTLWRLERPKQRIRCFLVEPPRGFWLGIERGNDLVFSETYDDLELALQRSEALKAPLIVAGWNEIEDDVTG